MSFLSVALLIDEKLRLGPYASKTLVYKKFKYTREVGLGQKYIVEQLLLRMFL